MRCRGVCEQHKVRKPGPCSRYEAGQSRCQHCDVWMITDESVCPCCKLKLRRRARRRPKVAVYAHSNNVSEVST